MDAWVKAGKETDHIMSISPDALADLHKKHPSLHILDVRKRSEYLSEHVINADNAPLDFLNDSMMQINRKHTYYVHCAGGYRSMIFVSALRARGYDNLIDIKGGFKAIKESGNFKISDYVCPSTML
jgi:rhodanese-related sulfurtransferase